MWKEDMKKRGTGRKGDEGKIRQVYKTGVSTPALQLACMTASQLNPPYECGEGMKVKVVKWC